MTHTNKDEAHLLCSAWSMGKFGKENQLEILLQVNTQQDVG